MTNTPVTQIIEELDKIAKWADGKDADYWDGHKEALQELKVFALTMLPVEKEQKQSCYIQGGFDGMMALERENMGLPEKTFEDYFTKDYKQYEGDNK